MANSALLSARSNFSQGYLRKRRRPSRPTRSMSASQRPEHQHLSSILPGKRRSTLCGYLVGCLVLRFQRSNGQIPGYQARTFPPTRQRIAYLVQALGGSGKAFVCFLSPRGGVILAQKLPAKVVLRQAWDGPGLWQGQT